MLSPPVARAGRVSITSPNHNVREKLNANAADFNTFRATASTTNTNSPSLMNRSVNEIVFQVNPFTLHFVDPVYEVDFYSQFSSSFAPNVFQISVRLFVLMGLLLLLEGISYDSSVSIYSTKLILIGISLLLILLLPLFRYVRNPYNSNSQWLLATFACCIAAVWVSANTVNSSSMSRDTDSAGIVLFIIILHCERWLLFSPLVLLSSIVSILFVILAVIFRPPTTAATGAEYFSLSPIVGYHESIPLTFWHCSLVVGTCIICCAATYQSELLTRKHYIANIKVEQARKEKTNYKKEAFALRDEVYLMTLERYDIADVDKQDVEFLSPMEQAMAILQKLCTSRSLSKDAFLDIQKVMSLLGSSSDVFKPKVEDAFAGKSIQLDDETERWIVDLVNGDTGQAINNPSGNLGTIKETPIEAFVNDQSPQAILQRMGSGLVQTKEETGLQNLLKNLDNWNFDVFEIHAATNGRPLLFMGTALFKKYDLINKFNIDRNKLTNFLTAVENGYHKNTPYHNSIHASDVARSVHFFIKHSMKSYLNDLEILGLIISSFVHDLDHPGKTNQYHIATRDPKAILYNDRSVLENHHCAQCYFLLMKEENNILSNLVGKDYSSLRKIIVELVLATDLGMHFDFLGQFKSSVGAQSIDKGNDKSRLMIMKMALKCGDLGHSAKSLILHEKWTLRITEEFYRQGDEERKQLLPISPFMDRQKANLPQSQIGFLDFLVIPMFNIWNKFLDLDENIFPSSSQLKVNREYWKSQIIESTNNPNPNPNSNTTAASIPSDLASINKPNLGVNPALVTNHSNASSSTNIQNNYASQTSPKASTQINHYSVDSNEHIHEQDSQFNNNNNLFNFNQNHNQQINNNNNQQQQSNSLIDHNSTPPHTTTKIEVISLPNQPIAAQSNTKKITIPSKRNPRFSHSEVNSSAPSASGSGPIAAPYSIVPSTAISTTFDDVDNPRIHSSIVDRSTQHELLLRRDTPTS